MRIRLPFGSQKSEPADRSAQAPTPPAKTQRGLIEAYGLEGWWKATFSPEQRAHIEAVYRPLESHGGRLTSGQVENPRPAPEFLMELSTWFGSEADRPIRRALRAKAAEIASRRQDTEPGHYHGRHYLTYVVDVEDMLQEGDIHSAEALLVALLGVMEAEVAAGRGTIEPWYYDRLAGLYERRGEPLLVQTVRSRQARFQTPPPPPPTNVRPAPPAPPPAPLPIPPVSPAVPPAAMPGGGGGRTSVVVIEARPPDAMRPPVLPPAASRKGGAVAPKKVEVAAPFAPPPPPPLAERPVARRRTSPAAQTSARKSADSAKAAIPPPDIPTVRPKVPTPGLSGQKPAARPPEPEPDPLAQRRTMPSRFVQIPLDELQANPDQPRRTFEEAPLQELAASIKERGVLEPIVVRPLPTEDGRPRYEIVMGERRVRAARMAGLPYIPALVRELSDRDAAADALLENFQREDLTPLDRARAIQSLLEMMEPHEVARTLGVSEATLRRHTELLKLPASVQTAFESVTTESGTPGEFAFTEGHALALLPLNDDPSTQVQLMAKARKEKLPIADMAGIVDAIRQFPEKKEAFLRVPFRITEQIVKHLSAQGELKKKYRPQSAERHFAALRKASNEITDLADERVAEHLSPQRLADLLSATHEAASHLAALNDALRKALRHADREFREVYIHCPVCGSVELTASDRCSLCASLLRRCYDCEKYDRPYERCGVDEYPVYVGEATEPKPHSRSYRCAAYTPKREVRAYLPVAGQPRGPSASAGAPD